MKHSEDAKTVIVIPKQTHLPSNTGTKKPARTSCNFNQYNITEPNTQAKMMRKSNLGTGSVQQPHVLKPHNTGSTLNNSLWRIVKKCQITAESCRYLYLHRMVNGHSWNQNWLNLELLIADLFIRDGIRQSSVKSM
ncbi:uncharacterized protein [Penaeus vannamei]|uniref:uncharacterized protein isoform X2 n=1 Tax=Penaeus vannamei TaxID=6689 RepID=UPI00387F39EC